MWWFVIIVAVVLLFAFHGSDAGTKQERHGSRESGKGREWPRERARQLTALEHATQSRRAWVPPGVPVRVRDVEIDGGMIYVGRELDPVERWVDADPALIDPDFPVARNGAGLAGDLGYWPSYADLHPAQRRAYLDWLASGRRDPRIPLGYVFLFFYGLERRILVDLALDPDSVHGELPALRKELSDLLQVHEDASFQGYGRSLLNILEVHLGEVEDTPPPMENPHWELPLEVRLRIGRMVARGERIPAEWAHLWVVCDPRANLRTPAKRCPREFDALFKIRYTEKYSEGIKVREPKTRLRIEHRSASRGISQEYGKVDLDVPDITSISGPQKKLQAIADQVQDELDSYSRHVGRHNDRASVAAQALLPAELVGTRNDEDTVALRELLERSAPEHGKVGRLVVRELAEIFPTKKAGKIYKGEARKLCDLIRKMGFGIEPDTARGGQNIGQSEVVSVYRLPEGEEANAADWPEAATLLLRLGSAVAASDDSITEEEELELERHLERMLSLTEPQRLRFRAHLRWSLTHPVSMRGVRAKAQSLSRGERARIAHTLLGVAGADGAIDPGEMESLTRIYEVLGFSERELYSDIHSLASGDSGPVTVKDAEPTNEYEISRPTDGPEGSSQKPTGPVELDKDKIRRISEESKAASALLASVFAEDEDPEAVSPPISVYGLDEVHSEIFQSLIQQERWSEGELTQLVARHGLFMGGVLEVINEAAFEACGEPLIEPGDGWELNGYAIEEMST